MHYCSVPVMQHPSQKRARWQATGATAIAIALASWLGSAGLAQPARAQDESAPVTPPPADTALAKRHFEAGVAAYESARYAEALTSFQEAYRLKPHPLVRVNMANCYDKLDRPIEALFHFELFLESKQGSPEQRAEVKAAIEELQKRVGRLALQITPEGANVFVDDEPARRTPIVDLITLRSGMHRVRAELEGHASVTEDVNVEAKTTTELTIALLPTRTSADAALAVPSAMPVSDANEPAARTRGEVPAQAAVVSESSATASDGLPTSVWIAGGVTLALAAAGTVTGVLALSAEDRFHDNESVRFSGALTVPAQQAAWDNAQAAADEAHALAITTDVLFGCALVSAIVTTVLLLSDDDDAAASPGSASLTPMLGTDGARLLVHGAF
jgi:hypothetical protein